MSLTLAQWFQVIVVDIPEAKADLMTLTVAAFAKKWIPRIEAYGFAVPAAEPIVSPAEAVKRLASGELGAIPDIAGQLRDGGG